MTIKYLCSSLLFALFFISALCNPNNSEGHGFELDQDYNKSLPPGKNTNVSISLFINRVSVVDESKEISLDLFLQVYWEDHRMKAVSELPFVELIWEQRNMFWTPDLYIRQLREMKVLSVFQEMTSLRLYKNSTLAISIGATVIIKCDMDFVLYPLDVQNCAVDFSSYKYTMQDMTFRWKGDDPVSFPSDFSDGYRLPKYVVSFTIDHELHNIYYGEGNHSTARLLITMSRELRSYLLECYLPSTLFVVMSWGGFCVIPEIVPGRMVLLVTTLLSLVTMIDTVRNNSPKALELKCIEVWLISCTLFVFLALIEYFIVLFGIRYDKHWRHKPKDLDKPCEPPPPPPPLPPPTVLVNHTQALMQGTAELPLLIHRGQNGNRIENLRAFGHRKIGPEDTMHKEPTPPLPPRLQMHRQEANVESSEAVREAGREAVRGARFRAVAEQAVLYCGSQRGMMDQVSLIIFPICFLLFTTVYWIIYLNASQKQMHK
ncbi:glycine receptor subunit alpha-4-like isoform X2 [Arctopsyche grandis]|uniref:glycine receptor subunit alpha-4-like isoform X2 n=1 Tax=Arctopsyche grandis TaxID=121162 RepID=UPI00406D9C0A